VQDDLFDAGRRGIENLARKFLLKATTSAPAVNGDNEPSEPRAFIPFGKRLDGRHPWDELEP
jgi:hypothetical protein